MSNKKEIKPSNPIVWMTIDFDKVKRRIDKISDQLDKVLLKFESQGAMNGYSKERNQQD